MVTVIETGLVVVASLAFIAAVWFTYRLSQETRQGTYWVAFLVAAIGLGSHEWLKIIDPLFGLDQETAGIIRELGVVVGALALAYGSYGIHTSVRTLKRRVGERDDG